MRPNKRMNSQFVIRRMYTHIFLVEQSSQLVQELVHISALHYNTVELLLTCLVYDLFNRLTPFMINLEISDS